jgi:hypothetical protein
MPHEGAWSDIGGRRRTLFTCSPSPAGPSRARWSARFDSRQLGGRVPETVLRLKRREASCPRRRGAFRLPAHQLGQEPYHEDRPSGPHRGDGGMP